MTTQELQATITIIALGMNIGGIIWAGSRLSATLGLRLDNIADKVGELTKTVNAHTFDLAQLNTKVAVVTTTLDVIKENGCSLAKEFHKV